MVEHSTADGEVPGSNPGAPVLSFALYYVCMYCWHCNFFTAEG